MSRLISFEVLSQKVLIAPLPWGLGHASRCVPIIERQLTEGKQVFIAAQGVLREFLAPRFPDVEFIELPFMEITYPADGNMARHFFWKGPSLLYSIWREHRLLKALIKKHELDLVISDSRFGLWSGSVKSIFITHQIEIQSPRLQAFINVINRWVMNQYDEVWIPDHETFPGLAGKLSHPKRMPQNYQYVGPLSRFKAPLNAVNDKKWKAVAIISGPEPQRSLFEAETVRRFLESDDSLLLLRGKPGSGPANQIGKIRIVPHLEDKPLIEELQQAELVIARSGYSTIMDLDALGIDSVEFHPTPGQTEQEYLAELHGTALEVDQSL